MLLNEFASGGNERQIKALSESVAAGRVSHAYILECEGARDPEALAKAFLKALLCDESRGYGCGECVTCSKIDHDNHEDVLYVRANDKGNITVPQIAQIGERLRVRPIGERNVAVILGAEGMNEQAQNKLLKTLEEPAGDSVILLLCGNTDNLLRTVISRCAVFRLSSPEGETLQEEYETAEALTEAVLCGDTFSGAAEVIGRTRGGRDTAIVILDYMERICLDIAAGRKKLSKNVSSGEVFGAVDVIAETRKDLQRNAAPQNALKSMALEILTSRGL